MSNRQKSSLYWWLLILILLAGCAQKGMASETPIVAFTATPIGGVVTPTIMESTAVVPTLPEPTISVPTDTIPKECKKVAFSEYDGVNYDIYTVCPDGSQLVNLTNDPADDVNPAWSPDGTQIAFSSSRSDHFQLYLMSADGKTLSPLTSDYENQFPVWLPDGKHIAFRTDDGKGLFWWRVMDLESLEVTTLSEPSYDFFYQTPAWSPDGKRIAYMSLVEQQERNDGSAQLHVRNVDGTNDIALTNDVWANVNPKWSPDGSKIAFLSERSGTYEMFALYMMNEDGTDVQKLTETAYPADAVYSWSPDGKQIVISSNNTFNGIYIIDIDSKTSLPLMDWTIPANVYWPSWQP